MANNSLRSRSPVRALDPAAYPSWDAPARPLSWSEPSVREVARMPSPEPALREPELCCPDCGASLQLALVRTEADPGTPPEGPRPVAPVRKHATLPDFDEAIREHKRALIVRALDENGGTMTHAAKALGLKYTTFVAMVHRLGIADEGATPG